MKCKEHGPSDYSKMLAGLREAAARVRREEFEKLFETNQQPFDWRTDETTSQAEDDG